MRSEFVDKVYSKSLPSAALKILLICIPILFMLSSCYQIGRFEHSFFVILELFRIFRRSILRY